MNLRTQTNLQVDEPLHGHGATCRLWLVVGGPGRVWLARPGFSTRSLRCNSDPGIPPVRSFNLPIQWLEPDTKHTGGTPVPLNRRVGFTLIELVLVLALLAMAVAVTAPSLSRFFRGRTLDNEARRMLSVTRYAQSRAVSEGVPMLLWLRPVTREYGLMSETTFADTDTKSVTYELDSSLAMEVDTLQFAGESPWKLAGLTTGSKQVIRFTPDGFVDENSPNWVWLKTTDESDAAWLVLSTNRLNYELGSLQPELQR